MGNSWEAHGTIYRSHHGHVFQNKLKKTIWKYSLKSYNGKHLTKYQHFSCNKDRKWKKTAEYVFGKDRNSVYVCVWVCVCLSSELADYCTGRWLVCVCVCCLFLLFCLLSPLNCAVVVFLFGCSKKLKQKPFWYKKEPIIEHHLEKNHY